MAEPVDMIVPLLREMRIENLNEHERTRALLTVLDNRLNSVEERRKVSSNPWQPIHL